MIRLKRVYEPAAAADGFRILVERLWPRGLSKQTAHVDLWLKEVAPTAELRRWYGHDVDKWPQFRQRYIAELRNNPAAEDLRRQLRDKKTVTFVYAARDPEHNSATALKSFIEKPTRA